MNRARGSWWWAQISRVVIYLGLSVLVSAVFPEGGRLGVMISLLIMGPMLIEIKVVSNSVTEEES